MTLQWTSFHHHTADNLRCYTTVKRGLITSKRAAAPAQLSCRQEEILNQDRYVDQTQPPQAWKKDQARIALLKHEFLLCQAHRRNQIYTWPYVLKIQVHAAYYHCHLSRYMDATADGSSWQSGSGDRPSKDPQQIVRFLCRHMRRHEEPKMQGGVTETLQIKRTSIDMRISGVLGFICIYVCFICADR